ncbi:MAG: amidohydrolase family protein, partial [Candidatus Binataceae bacterium]
MVDKAELVLHEGLIAGHRSSDSIAISQGRIVAHGKFSDLKGRIGPRTHMLKLAGRAVVPGFIDSHIHFFEAAAAATGMSVARARTIEGLLADLRLACGKAPPGNWLRAFGCDETLLAERRGPTVDELERAVPKNPLRLRHQTLHASWLNARAIAQLGLDKPDFRPPGGAMLVRDATGKLTGLAVAMEEWITSKLPRVTKAETEARARIMSRELASAGVTAFTDATVKNGAEELEVFDSLAASQAIVQRARLMLGAEPFARALGSKREDGEARVAIGGIKFMTGAAFDVRRATKIAMIARSRGLDCAFHATEVEELEQALAVIEGASVCEGADAPAWRIEHGGLIPPNYIARIAAAGAWVVTNPGFIHFRGAKYADDPGLVPHLY